MNYNSDKLAAIDIGTNSFHLIVAKINKSGNFEIVDREKDVIRLGEGNKGGDIKEIKPEAVQRAIVCLKRFKGIADAHSAPLRAIATSAMREALNRHEVHRKILAETGVDIEIVSGIEEARLIYLGVLKAVPIFNKKAICVDIGGGSTEFTIGEKGSIKKSISLKLGAVRMSQSFFPDFIIKKERVKKAEEWVEGILFPIINKLKNEGFEICVGSSGSVMATALMIEAQKKNTKYNDTILNNYKFSLKELNKIKETILSKKTTEERLKIPGLDPKRADIIPAGVIILHKILQMLGVKELLVSGYALREGIIIDSLSKLHSTKKTNLQSIKLDSIKNIAKACNFDRKHCAHVANLALHIFDATKPLHNLSNIEREYLQAASLLHDIGYHIAHNQHHKHSFYIIRNSELLGFNDREINIIANIARYHRKSHPKSNHKDFSTLSEKSQKIVKILAGILRVADALDRTHQRNTKKLNLKIFDKRILLEISGSAESPDIEIWNVGRRKLLFEKVFKRELEIKFKN